MMGMAEIGNKRITERECEEKNSEAEVAPAWQYTAQAVREEGQRPGSGQGHQ